MATHNDADRTRTLSIIFQGDLSDRAVRDDHYQDKSAQLERLELLIDHHDLKLPLNGQSSRTPTASELRRMVMDTVRGNAKSKGRPYSGLDAFKFDPSKTLTQRQRLKYLQLLDVDSAPQPASLLPSGAAEQGLTSQQPASAHDPHQQLKSLKSADSSAHGEDVTTQHSSETLRGWLNGAYAEPAPPPRRTTARATPTLQTGVVEPSLAHDPAVEIPDSDRPTPSPLTSDTSDTTSKVKIPDIGIRKRAADTAFGDQNWQEGAEAKRQKTEIMALSASGLQAMPATTGRAIDNAQPSLARSCSQMSIPHITGDKDLRPTVPAHSSVIGLAASTEHTSTATKPQYPDKLRGVDDVESRIDGILQLMKNTVNEIVEVLEIDNAKVQFVPDPKPDLELLYKRTMCRDGESWKVKASQLGLRGIRMQDMLMACIGAAIHEEIFCKKVPWKTSREILQEPEMRGRLKSLSQLIPSLEAKGSCANAEYLIYQSGADMLWEGTEFDRTTVAAKARSLAETFLLTIQAQLKYCDSQLDPPDEFAEETTTALAKIFRKALLLRGAFEEAPCDFEYTWAPSMSPFIAGDMAEIRSLDGVGIVVGSVFPGIWERDELGDLQFVSKLRVYGRPATRRPVSDASDV
ncbi:hypothetical protein Slin15195_G118490 [Septoria linicola]|uniref:Uncharacterized protein n=1 Tax=Septoria linicola TaxID=215465 RepID=A0A9Q9EPX4_9PEZI|nr:hypothetical protein Slin14017_G095480 [Septoria linicola]USW58530.1 hypothetical protein Slin15195_G118490 [Septoria linicola]